MNSMINNSGGRGKLFSVGNTVTLHRHCGAMDCALLAGMTVVGVSVGDVHRFYDWQNNAISERWEILWAFVRQGFRF